MQVIAHRGASRAERENTVAAFRRAASMGADAVELDVRRSNDGVLVVHHDPLPAGALGTHVPTLAEALDACTGMWVNIEIKNDVREPDFDPSRSLAEATLDVLADAGSPHRWVISSFDLTMIDRCRVVMPDVRTAWLTSLHTSGVFDVLADHGHGVWHPNAAVLTEADIRAAHARGIVVNTWTVDDPQRIADLAAWGVDGVCTNVPDVALRVRASARVPMTD
jgi:glycerophosphoryl diester phosphodiesterase